MPTKAIKYENFFPEKVYQCFCLKKVIDKIWYSFFNNDIRCYSEIILAVTEYCQSDPNLYCLRVHEKSNCLFLCQAHMIITLVLEAKSDCTSMDEKDLF